MFMERLAWIVYYLRVFGKLLILLNSFNFSAVYFDKSVFIFGGCTATNTTFNDLWTFDLSLNQWIRLQASGNVNHSYGFSLLM